MLTHWWVLLSLMKGKSRKEHDYWGSYRQGMGALKWGNFNFVYTMIRVLQGWK